VTRRLALLVALLALGSPIPAVAVTFADGAVHVIDASSSFPAEETTILDAPGGAPTTVQVDAGGELGTGGLGFATRVFDSSLLVVNAGGRTDTVVATDSSHVSVAGQTGHVVLDAAASLDVLSGIITTAIFASQDSSVFIDRGCFCSIEARDNASIEMVRGGAGTVRGFNSATFVVSAGMIASLTLNDQTAAWISGVGLNDPSRSPDIGYLDLFGSASLTMTGGSIDQHLHTRDSTSVVITGGDVGPSLTAAELATIEIYGSGFNFPLGDLPVGSAQLTGLLADGTPIDTIYGRGENARITLIPEPSTVALLGLGFIVLGRRRRGV
jgi:hypothetical protein